MPEELIVMTCPDCGQRLRFPYKEYSIRFKCANTDCQKLFVALKGKLVNKTEDDKNGIDKEDEVHKEQESGDKVESSEGNNNESNAAEKKGNIINKNDLKAARKVNWKDQIWKIVAIFFICSTLFLITLNLNKDKDKKQKDELTSTFVTYLRRISQDNLNEIKPVFTKETSELFSMFIESQYLYNDSASLVKLNDFIKSIQPLENTERRKFMYQNTSGDTMYFHADYIMINGEYYFNIDIGEFIDY